MRREVADRFVSEITYSMTMLDHRDYAHRGKRRMNDNEAPDSSLPYGLGANFAAQPTLGAVGVPEGVAWMATRSPAAVVTELVSSVQVVADAPETVQVRAVPAPFTRSVKA